MHKANAVIIMCIDFRFQRQTQKWLETNGYIGTSDEIVITGGSRDLVKPIAEFHKESLLRQIELSMRLHAPDRIVIIDHQDCGGYAQDGTIPGRLLIEEDKNYHAKWAENAKDILTQLYPGKEIGLYYATLDGSISEY